MDYIDFNIDVYYHTSFPIRAGLAVADVDKNGLDDIFVGGNGTIPANFFCSNRMENFWQRICRITSNDIRQTENMGLLFFDADNDGDPDLYWVVAAMNYSWYQKLSGSVICKWW